MIKRDLAHNGIAYFQELNIKSGNLLNKKNMFEQKYKNCNDTHRTARKACALFRQ